MELRNKVNNTDIVFNLMPKLFTVGELKQVCELLLGKNLVNSAFRRWINDRIEFSGKYVSIRINNWNIKILEIEKSFFNIAIEVKKQT